MTAFTATPITHAQFLSAIQAHTRADRITQGVYWDFRRQRGCAVGCGIESVMSVLGVRLDHEGHAAYARYTGIPEDLVRLQDRLFEGMALEAARLFPLAFASAITPGSNLDEVARRFTARTLREIVLPVAGNNAAIVERIASGFQSNWQHDNAVTALTVAFAAGNGVIRSAADDASVAAATAGWALEMAQANNRRQGMDFVSLVARAVAKKGWHDGDEHRDFSQRAYRDMAAILIEELQHAEVEAAPVSPVQVPADRVLLPA